MRFLWWGVSVLLVATGVACKQAPCSPENCDGCCNSANECVSGTVDTACGFGAADCQACTGDKQCRNGICRVPTTSDGGTVVGACDVTSCAGCCANGFCIEFGRQTSGVCGKRGAACGACSSPTPLCNNGTCDSSLFCDGRNCASGCCAGATCILTPTKNQCGSAGRVCEVCDSDTTCAEGACMELASDAGVKGCRVIRDFATSAQSISVGGDPVSGKTAVTVVNYSAVDPTRDAVVVRVLAPETERFPLKETFTAATTLSSCQSRSCLLYYANCSTSDLSACQLYVPNSGELTVDSAFVDGGVGANVGGLTPVDGGFRQSPPVRLYEWSQTPGLDEPLASKRCIRLDSFSVAP